MSRRPHRKAQGEDPVLAPRLFRDLPEDERVCDEVAELVAMPDFGALLADVSDQELLLVMRLSRLHDDVITDLHAIGVSCPNRRLPKSARILRARLNQSLTAGSTRGRRLLLHATDPVSRTLVARAGDVPLSSLDDFDPQIDTPSLHNLALAVALPRGTSVTMTIIALLKLGDTQLEGLLNGDTAAIARAAADQISDLGWTRFKEWAPTRIGIIGESASVAPSHGDDVDESAVVTTAVEVSESPQPTAAASQKDISPPTSLRGRPEEGTDLTYSPEPIRPDIPESGPLSAHGGDSAGHDLAALNARLEKCAAQLPDASDAARRLAQRIETGQAPSDDDLDLVLHVSRSLAELTASSGALFGEGTDLNLASLRRALHELSDGRAELLALAAVASTAGGLDDALTSLNDEITRITDHWPPRTPEDIELADALQTLRTLIEDSDRGGLTDEGAFDRGQELLQAIPPMLRKVVLAATLRQLTFAVPGDPVAGDLNGDHSETRSHKYGDTSRPTLEPESDPDAASSQSTPPPEVITRQPEGLTVGSSGAGGPTSTPGDTATPQSATPTRAEDTKSAHTPRDAKETPGESAPHDHVDASTTPARVTAAVTLLLGQGRTALAHHILRQIPDEQDFADVLHVAALAQHSRTRSGPCALELGELCQAVDAEMLTAHQSQFLSTAALVKVALITGDSYIGKLVTDLADQLPTTWARMTHLAAETVSSGFMLAEHLDEAQYETASKEAARIASRRVEIPATMRVQRERQVLNLLRSPDGEIGASLRAAAANDSSGVDAARELASKLTRGEAHIRVVTAGRELGRSGKALSDEHIEEIVDILMADRDALARWASAASRTSDIDDAENFDWGRARLVALKELLGKSTPTLLDELAAIAAGGQLANGQADLARRLLTDIIQLIDGKAGSSDPEESVQRVMSSELLKVGGAALDEDSDAVTLPTIPAGELLEALLAAAEEDSWEPAMNRHVGDDNFGAAKRCATLCDLEPGGQGTYGEHVEGLLRQRRAELSEQAQELRLLLVQARRAEDESTQDSFDSVDASLGEIELLLGTKPEDLRPVLDKLALLRNRTADLRDQTITSLSRRLADLELDDADRQRLGEQIAKGEFDAVDDEITNRELNKGLPTSSRPADLERFFPAVPDAMPDGIDDGLLGKIRNGESVGTLDFSVLGSRADRLCELLANWAKQGRTLRAGGRGWDREEARDLLIPALAGVGINAPGTSLSALDTPGAMGAGWKFVSIRDATHIGKAMVPAFGSQANRHYRLLLAYNKQDVLTLDSLRQGDGSTIPLIICYFGTISSADRLELARLWSDPTIRPTIILDDAALTHVLTTQGKLSGSLFASLMSITLPFTATAPFSAEKQSTVPIEMFYGRDREQRRIESMTDSSLIYGGRGMGKSALLSRIKEQADNTPGAERKAILVELPRDDTFDEPETIWATLAEEFERAGLTAGRAGGRAKKQTQVERMVDTWLQEHPDGQLLIMLDEVDAFFNADARRGFNQTTKLFNLKNRNRLRCKVTFSGLHSVNHFHGTGNVPFSPSGAIQIGPLEPADAYRLLTGPLHAMGYALDIKQSQRISMHCNYQPYLIQMFAEQLVAILHGQRSHIQSGPPWTISEELVKRVMSDPAMRDKIFRAFKLTLDLDKRFLVIVNLLARQAYSGRRTPLTDPQLLDECKSTWPAGFAETPIASFRELQHELEGLGILGPHDSSGYRMLRTSALLPSLGSQAEIEQNLAEVAELALPENEARGLMRPSLDDNGRPGPLTTEQIATLAGRKGNRTNVLIGSPALGIESVMDALRGTHNSLRRIEEANDGGAFRRLLRTGESGEVRMTVVSELWRKAPHREACQESLNNAQSDEFLPPDASSESRAVVLVAGPTNAEWLEEDLTRDPQREGIVVKLDRFTARTLPLQWRDQPKLQDLASPNLATSVLQVTGGWPAIVDSLAERTPKLGADAALNELAEEQKDPEWPERFLRDTGAVGVSSDLQRLVAAMADFGGSCPSGDLEEIGLSHGINDVGRAVTLAQWFSLLDESDDQQLDLAPLLLDAWRRYETN
jgi:hypothetical protein